MMQASATMSHVQARALPQNAVFVSHTRNMRQVYNLKPFHVVLYTCMSIN
jgi:hypothetical protein